MTDVQVIQGDCIEVMRGMEPDSVDAVVTDPPYGLEFMGKEWDSFKSWDDRETDDAGAITEWAKTKGRKSGNKGYSGILDSPSAYRAGKSFQAWCEQWATEALRVLKPGGHLLAFGGTRTSHRMVCAIEDAGFEIRDSIHWMYGSGFPKSLDVSKAIDKQGGTSIPPDFALWLRSERQKRGMTTHDLCERGGFYKNVNHGGLISNWEAGIGTPDATQFNALCDLLDLPFEQRKSVEREILGWRPVVPGVAFTSDGPSILPITEPATDAAKQWEGWGTALKPAHEPIVVARKPLIGTVAANVLTYGTGGLNIDGCRIAHDEPIKPMKAQDHVDSIIQQSGRYEETTELKASGRWPANVVFDEAAAAELDEVAGSLSTCGGPKKTTHDSGMFGIGQPGTVYSDKGGPARFFYTPKASRSERGVGNDHPTVKPLSLMRWLVRLVTPPGGTVLDPFAGSGTTISAAIAERCNVIGIEMSAEYCEIIRKRTSNVQQTLPMEEAI